MSIDIGVITSKRISFDEFNKICTHIFSPLKENTSVSQEASSFEIKISGGGIIFVYEEKANLDNLPDSVFDIPGEKKWQYTFSHSLDNKFDKEISDLVSTVAKNGCGLVFDPANEKILFSSITSEAQPKTKREKKYIDLVGLSLFFNPNCVAKNFPDEMIKLFEMHFKNLLPVTIEDFPKSKKMKLPKSDYSAFVSEWQKLSLREYRSTLKWYCKIPNCEGSMHFPDKRPRNEHDPFYVKICSLNLKFESTLFDSDSVQQIFLRLCKSMKPFYGCGFIVENIAMIGRTQYFENGKTLDYRISAPDKWQGLPQDQTWLSWFGPSYRECLKEQLQVKDCKRVDSSEGIFVSLGDDFMKKSDLKTKPLYSSHWVMPTKEIPEILI